MSSPSTGTAGTAGGWRLADAQLASTHITTALAVDFDPMDVPRDRFLVAGAALRLTASGAADPRSFGIPLPDRLLAGEWFVINNVRLGLAALKQGRDTALGHLGSRSGQRRRPDR